MITVSLDEFGIFEDRLDEKSPAVIAGVIFDDKDEKYEQNTEKKRIRAYYKAAVAKASELINLDLEYPKDLHFHKGEFTKEEKAVINRRIAAVKRVVTNTFGEFLRDGTFEGKELYEIHNSRECPFEHRKGEYFVYAIAKSESGKSSRIGVNASNYIRDSRAGNLYFHMASEVLAKIVFQNHLLGKKEKFDLEIATRRTGYVDKNSEKGQEWKDNGYTRAEDRGQKNDSPKNKAQYIVGNQDIYRTVIEMRLADDNPNEVNVEKLVTIPANYDQDANMEFIYLADSICSIYQYELETQGNLNEQFCEIYNRSKKLVDDARILVFAYDDIDSEFDKAVKAYQRGDFYQALSTVYDSRLKTGAIADYYKNNLFSYVEKQIEKSSDYHCFKKAVRSLQDSLLSNDFQQERGLYIFSALGNTLKNVIKSSVLPEREQVFYYYYECGMKIYCHLGSSKLAGDYFDKMREYAHLVGVETFLGSRNSYVVSLCDNFEFAKAIELAQENLSYARELDKVRKHIEHLKSVYGNKEKAKAYSQYGQTLAFVRNPLAKDMFEKAMLEFVYGSADYYITLSYLLHFYIDNNMKAEYKAASIAYFGGKTKPLDQLRYLITEGTKEASLINVRYALYVFVKGLYYFDSDEIDKQLWGALSNLNRYTDSLFIKKEIMGKHPTELICKYLQLLAIKKNDKEALSYYREIQKKSIEKSGIIVECIDMLIDAKVYKAESAEVAYWEKISQIWDKLIAENYGIFAGYKQVDDIKAKEELICKAFTFMYD